MIGSYSSPGGDITAEQIKHKLDEKQAFLGIGEFHLVAPLSYSDDELIRSAMVIRRINEESGFLLRQMDVLIDQRAAQREAERIAAREHHAEPHEVEVIHLTEAEYEAAVANDLAALGCTYEQLVEMARTGDYPTPDHRLMWLRIKPLPGDVHVADDLVEVACPARHKATAHPDHTWEYEGGAVWCPGFVPEPDVLASPCERWSLEVEHDAHFFGEGLRCPGWSPEAGEDR